MPRKEVKGILHLFPSHASISLTSPSLALSLLTLQPSRYDVRNRKAWKERVRGEALYPSLSLLRLVCDGRLLQKIQVNEMNGKDREVWRHFSFMCHFFLASRERMKEATERSLHTIISRSLPILHPSLTCLRSDPDRRVKGLGSGIVWGKEKEMKDTRDRKDTPSFSLSLASQP